MVAHIFADDIDIFVLYIHNPLLSTFLFMCMLAIQDCIVRIRQGLSSAHRESRQKRRELRNRMKAEQEIMENRMRQLQLANESKQAQLEALSKVLWPSLNH